MKIDPTIFAPRISPFSCLDPTKQRLGSGGASSYAGAPPTLPPFASSPPHQTSALTEGQRLTWQSGRKRGLHQTQIESLSSLLQAVVAEVEAEVEVGGICAVELGAGKALLGRCFAEVRGHDVGPPPPP